ncbi:glycerol kinase GlpK [Arsukibacterium sp.]|uniref:glycerol kinase GlpK n=1 Tax=Arsukibacterium sp. TaxID=1977258 RepID=UPI002FD8850E
MSEYILAIDQGTTSSRAMLYNRQLKMICSHSEPVSLLYPKPGWVEQDPEALWQTVVSCIQQLLQKAAIDSSQLAALALTNQRETTLLWDKHNGQALYNAIVWQDRRTADNCQALQAQQSVLQAKTGLLADPYFSATKLQWLLDTLPEARARAERAELCFGTVDSYLMWRLSGGKVHVTDATNASRTLLFNIHNQQWDPELIALFNIPPSVLPEVLDSAAEFCITDSSLFAKALPVLSVLGDQQAALLGHGCIKPGMLKSTYGTGCFAMVNTGSQVHRSQHKLLSTIAWRLNGQCCYALEGSIFMAGAIIQWLRDKLGIIQQASDSELLAQGVSYQQPELLIPAFTGLGAPHWQPKVQAALLGLSRDSGKADICAAALCSVAYQTEDLLQAMRADGIEITQLRVDGGMTANHWFLQALADLTQQEINRCHTSDASVFGTAALCAVQLGWLQSINDIAPLAQSQQSYQPVLAVGIQQQLYQRWCLSVQQLIAQQL